MQERGRLRVREKVSDLKLKVVAMGVPVDVQIAV